MRVRWRDNAVAYQTAGHSSSLAGVPGGGMLVLAAPSSSTEMWLDGSTQSLPFILRRAQIRGAMWRPSMKRQRKRGRAKWKLLDSSKAKRSRTAAP